MNIPEIQHIHLCPVPRGHCLETVLRNDLREILPARPEMIHVERRRIVKELRIRSLADPAKDRRILRITDRMQQIRNGRTGGQGFRVKGCVPVKKISVRKHAVFRCVSLTDKGQAFFEKPDLIAPYIFPQKFSLLRRTKMKNLHIIPEYGTAEDRLEDSAVDLFSREPAKLLSVAGIFHKICLDSRNRRQRDDFSEFIVRDQVLFHGADLRNDPAVR